MTQALDTSESFEAKLNEIAAKLELPLAETSAAIDSIYNDALRSVYRYPKIGKDGKPKPLDADELDLNRRCEEAYAKRNNGQSWPTYRRKIRASALFGMPGHGKTTAFEVASRRVASDLNMRFISAEELEFVPYEEIDKNSYVFVSQETAGVASALEFFGLPSNETLPDGTKVMGRLFTLPLMKLMKAGAGTLLLDDFLNAQRNIQDVGLSLTDRRRIGQLNLEQTYFGVTGNLGSLDDTNASRASSALRNRCLMMLAHDTPKNFIQRLYETEDFKDELGDGFIRMFLQRYEKYFSEMPKRGTQGAFTSPRSLRDFVDEARDCLHRHGGRKNALAARQELYQLALRTLGVDTANAYNGFLEAVLTKADPLAREIIVEGKISHDEIGKSYKAGGFSASEQGFAYQFALALVDYTVQKVIRDDDLQEACERLAKGLSILDSSVFAFALDELQVKLAAQVETVQKGKVKVSVASNTKGKRREINADVTEKIGHYMLGTGFITSEQRATMVSVMSEMNKYDSRAGGLTRRPKKTSP